jgi:hypothetical protein
MVDGRFVVIFHPVLSNQVLCCYVEDITSGLAGANLRRYQKMGPWDNLLQGWPTISTMLTIIRVAGLLMASQSSSRTTGASPGRLFRRRAGGELTRQLLMFSRKM